MIVRPLGTVSPYCKDDKNCPGFLVISNKQKVLLDCGSGTSRNLKMPEDLENLVIIISHLHKDHYCDLSSIAYASFVYKNLGMLKSKIKVYIPNDKSIKDYEYLTNYGEENFMEFISYNSDDCIKEKDIEITFAVNPHSPLTHSIKVKSKNKCIVYSSDTGYNNNTLTTFAKNTDLLICESTFLKGQTKKSDTHLYAFEAATIAKEANVKTLALTHFWPEIDKQDYVNEAKEIFNNTIGCEENIEIILRWIYERKINWFTHT